ncbi:MAG TPA: hypothetical protein VGG19_00675 [Tepidisphaeraceae bacterium]|jgi:hypothetical protein
MEATVNGTAEAWRQRIAMQRSSGQSIRAWCRQNNLHEHAFYWWRSRLGLSPKLPARRQRRASKPIRFAEVVVGRPVTEPMRLCLGGGRELLLPASMPVDQVAQLISALEVSA